MGQIVGYYLAIKNIFVKNNDNLWHQLHQTIGKINGVLPLENVVVDPGNNIG